LKIFRRREPLGYVAGTGLLFQASSLFVGLIFVLILGPFIAGTPFVLADVVVVFIFGLTSSDPLSCIRWTSAVDLGFYFICTFRPWIAASGKSYAV
jgi:hypothetical protein